MWRTTRPQRIAFWHRPQTIYCCLESVHLPFCVVVLTTQKDYNDGRSDTARVTASGMYSMTRTCYTEDTQFLTDTPAVFNNSCIEGTTKREWLMCKLTAVSVYLSDVVDSFNSFRRSYHVPILFFLMMSGVWALIGLLDMYLPNISSNQLTMPPSQITFESFNAGFLSAHSSFDVQSSMSAENKKKIKLLEKSLQALAIRFNSEPEVYVAALKEVVKSLVDEALAKYNADKTEMADYALETSGGSVILSRCSRNFIGNDAIFSIFGIPMLYKSNSPRTAIQDNVNRGECWSFAGNSGTLMIELSHMIKIIAFSVEHIPKSISPGGHIDDAPKEFSVYSLSKLDDPKGVYLGTFIYNDDGKPLQQFFTQVKNAKPTKLIKLQISSNHGNLKYTCLYRFRVHGVRHTP